MAGTAKTVAKASVGWIIYAAIIVAFIFAAFFFIGVIEWLVNGALKYLVTGSIIAVAIDLLICLPLAFFSWSRSVSSVGFMLSCWLFGLTAWAGGFTITYEYWGKFGVFVGLFVAGIGVVPTGLLASLFHGAWTEFFSLIILGVLFLLAIGGSSFAERGRR